MGKVRITICTRCQATIQLVPVGLHSKWVTNPEKPKASWKCMPTRDFPVRSHNPENRHNYA